MQKNYDAYTVRQLRELVWTKELVPKRWMLNYIKKKEAIELLVRFSSAEEVPDRYIDTIKSRNSQHRKKVYNSKKSRQKKFGATLTREERLKFVINSAERLLFKERKEVPEGFTSFLGSTRGKYAYVFVDVNEEEYLFTKLEVRKLSSMGLFVPRGAMTGSTAAPKTESRKLLKDILNGHN